MLADNKYKNRLTITIIITLVCFWVPFLLGHGGMVTTTPFGVCFYAGMFLGLELNRHNINQMKNSNLIKTSLIECLGMIILFALFLYGKHQLVLMKFLETESLWLYFFLFASSVEVVVVHFSARLICQYINLAKQESNLN